MAKWGEGDPRWIVEERPGKNAYTICPRSTDPFCMVSYYIKWVTTSWTATVYDNFIFHQGK